MQLSGRGDVCPTLFAGVALRERAMDERLTSLHLGGMGLTCAAVAALAAAFTHGAAPRLVALRLQRNRIRDATPLFECLRTAADAEIEDGAAAGNTRRSRAPQALQCLLLHSNPLGSETIDAFAAALRAGGLPALCEGPRVDTGISPPSCADHDAPLVWLSYRCDALALADREASDREAAIADDPHWASGAPVHQLEAAQIAFNEANNMILGELRNDYDSETGEAIVHPPHYDLFTLTAPHALKVSGARARVANGIYILSADERAEAGRPVWRRVDTRDVGGLDGASAGTRAYLCYDTGGDTWRLMVGHDPHASAGFAAALAEPESAYVGYEGEDNRSLADPSYAESEDGVRGEMSSLRSASGHELGTARIGRLEADDPDLVKMGTRDDAVARLVRKSVQLQCLFLVYSGGVY